MEKTLGSKNVFECPIFTVEEAEVELPNGRVEKRWYVLKPDAVFIIPVDQDDNILLIREWRSANQAYFTRLVAGSVEAGEDPKETALRELREEIGLGAGSLELLFKLPNASGWIKQDKFCFLARDLYHAPLDSGDEFEKPELLPTSRDAALELIDRGEIHGDLNLALRMFLTQK